MIKEFVLKAWQLIFHPSKQSEFDSDAKKFIRQYEAEWTRMLDEAVKEKEKKAS